jgi:hypothetical protein
MRSEVIMDYTARSKNATLYGSLHRVENCRTHIAVVQLGRPQKKSKDLSHNGSDIYKKKSYTCNRPLKPIGL